jgi:histidinol-phosphate phosphatase family protein
VGYPRDPDQVRLLPGAADALRQLQARGYALVVISNQSGIGRGWVTQHEADRVHEYFISELEEHGVRLTGAYYCPHAPNAGCTCRKPATALLERAVTELNLLLSDSYVVGDKASDIELGIRAGCRTVRFGTSIAENDPPPDAVAADWPSVVKCILNSGGVTR